MELTEFGKELRKFRVDRGELQKEMAAKLGINKTYLSGIERGKHNVPPFLIPRLKERCGISEEQAARLEAARDLSLKTIAIDLSCATDEQRKVALLFARALRELTDGQCEAIRDILLHKAI